MKARRTARRRLAVLLGALTMASVPTLMAAKDASGEADPERVERIRRAIELDTQRLDWLEDELRVRKEWFEELTTTFTEVKAERDEARARLDGATRRGADATRAEALRTEVQALEEDVRLVETQTELALEAEKAVRQQMEALEAQIRRQRLALGRLTGDNDSGSPGADGGEAPIGSDGAHESPRTTPRASMTAARRARERLERIELEVQIAQRERSEILEQQQALEEQIDFAQQLVKGEDVQREKLEAALAARAERLQQYRADDAPEDRIARRARTNRRLETILEEAVQSRGSRVENIESLQDRLDRLQEAERRVTEELDEAQARAHRVRRRLQWLRSPLHPQNVADWLERRGPVLVVAIVFAALLLLVVWRLRSRRGGEPR